MFDGSLFKFQIVSQINHLKETVLGMNEKNKKKTVLIKWKMLKDLIIYLICILFLCLMKFDLFWHVL